jgi:hypothetical protein
MNVRSNVSNNNLLCVIFSIMQMLIKVVHSLQIKLIGLLRYSLVENAITNQTTSVTLLLRLRHQLRTQSRRADSSLRVLYSVEPITSFARSLVASSSTLWMEPLGLIMLVVGSLVPVLQVMDK